MLPKHGHSKACNILKVKQVHVHVYTLPDALFIVFSQDPNEA